MAGRVFQKINIFQFQFLSIRELCIYKKWNKIQNLRFLFKKMVDCRILLEIQRKFRKIQRKNTMINIFDFWASKLFSYRIYDIGLYSWGPTASFDTHMDILVSNKVRMPDMSFMSFMSKMSILTCIACDIWYH